MSYYLTISIFPFLIVVYAILTSLNISSENLYMIWAKIIPADVLTVIVNYFKYIGGQKSAPMLVIGIIVTMTSSSSAFGSLLRIMADIQGKPRFKGFWANVFSVVISLGLLIMMYVSGLVIVTGEWLLNFLQKTFGLVRLFEFWQWVRFDILFTLLLAIIYLIYKISAPRENTKIRRLPGALAASVLLVVVSIIFSRLIGSAANYPIIYGSLASFIILMIWIFICSIILIMGNVFNYSAFHKEPVIREYGKT
jgi:membrane protein